MYADLNTTSTSSPINPQLIRAHYSPLNPPASELLSKLHKELAKAEETLKTTLINERSALARKIMGLKKRLKISAKKDLARNLARDLTKQRLHENIKFSQRYRELVQSANSECLELCLKILSQFLQDYPDLQLAGLSKRIARAVSTTLYTGDPVIFVNQSEINTLKKLLSGLAIELHLKEDSGVLEGTARLESSIGTIDFNWQEELAAIAKSLRLEIQSKLEKDAEIIGK